MKNLASVLKTAARWIRGKEVGTLTLHGTHNVLLHAQLLGGGCHHARMRLRLDIKVHIFGGDDLRLQ